MAKPRVHQVAKEVGIPAKDAMRLLAEMGVPAISASGTITPRQAEDLRRAVDDRRQTRQEESQGRSSPVHPSARAAQVRRSLLSRAESDWSRFDFSNADQRAWIVAGVPIDKAHLAAIARESSRRDRQGPRITADTLRQECRPGERVIDALVAGTNAIRVEERLAKRGGQPLRGVDEQLLAVATSSPLPAETDVDGLVEAFRAAEWTPRSTPRVADLLIRAIEPREPRLRALAVLGEQVSRYSADRTVGSLLSAYARAHGVFHVDEHLELLCREGMDESVADAPKTLVVLQLLRDAVRSRNFYFIREGARSALSMEATGSSQDQPGVRAGIGFTEDISQAPGSVVAWSPGPLGETVCITLSSKKQARLLSGKNWLTEVETYAAYVEQAGSAAAMIAGLTTPQVRASSTTHPGDEGPPAQPPPGTRLRDVVMHYRSSSDDQITNPSPRPRHSPDHRWLVRGHYRRQWSPRTQTHTRIWIEEHESGPADKPLLILERVIVS
ncbi:translation initiation factor IF-2 N-terminal domain-containing protein [Janibacter limosus]|uniref:translation initiation factor IF-2 N-terminal domain-containing protein n=1 Tax=Janibacter limosus TaxID=53458 RepID=UPI000A07800E|nr:translation initiation factor IF-2 N-terminal domain-containing protein [Janibacter limosus]